MERSIATQAATQSINYALNQNAYNLAAHANATLSRAHGWNILKIPDGTLDQEGNDISKYRDNRNGVVGNYFLAIAYNNVVYYAPSDTTTLDGQEPNDGFGVYAGTVDTVDIGKETALITTLGSDLAAILQAINDNVLVQHTQLGDQVAHNTCTVVAKNVYDSSGAQIGTHVAVISYEGFLYEIPCTPRLGGVPVPPLFAAFSPNSKYNNLPGGAPPNWDYTITPNFLGGNGPFVYSYEYYKAGVWHPVTPDADVVIPWADHGTSEHGSAGVTSNYKSDTGELTFLTGAPGGNDYASVRVRLTVTGVGGSTHVDTSGNDLTFDFQVQDQAGKWFCSEARKAMLMSDEDRTLIMQVESYIGKKNERLLVAYLKYGETLVERMRNQGVEPTHFAALIKKVLECARNERFDEALDLYIDFSSKALQQYWPDTEVPILKKLLGDLDARNR